MDKKNYVIIALVCAIAVMAVGYSLLSQSLQINGNATITSNWNVAITGITEGDPQGTTATNAEAAEYDGTSATFNVNLVKPGDKMVYEITVSNEGTLNAELTGMTVNPSNTADTGIYYKVTGVTQDETTLDASETNTVTVEVGWVATDTSTPTEKTVPLTVNLTYTQY